MQLQADSAGQAKSGWEHSSHYLPMLMGATFKNSNIAPEKAGYVDILALASAVEKYFYQPVRSAMCEIRHS